jgi:hypothetical protein
LTDIGIFEGKTGARSTQFFFWMICGVKSTFVAMELAYLGDLNAG